MKTEPLYPYQQDAVLWLSGRTRGLLRLKAGYGKTRCLLEAATLGVSTSTPILILCPKSVIGSWEHEIKKWGYDKFNITVTNWDKLISWSCLKKLKGYKWEVVIGDESHRALRNPETQRAKAFNEILRRRPDARIYLATATVAGNSAADYYQTFEILISKSLGDYKTWQKKFCNIVDCAYSYSGVKYAGFKEEETPTIKKILDKISFTVSDEYANLHLPPEVIVPLAQPFDIGLDAMSEALSISTGSLETMLEQGTTPPAHIATYVKSVGLAKVVPACDWIESFPGDESLVIFAWHRDVIYQLSTQLNIPRIMGDTPQDIRDKLIQQFQNGEIKRLVLNIQSGGVGISLHQKCNNALFVEMPWSTTAFVQAKARIRRIGSKNPCFYHIMTMQKTIDTKILEVLEYKQKNIERIENV